MCQQHQPYPAQFSFASDRGTDMAVALAHGVSEYFSRRGSMVFTCSLDAQGAFDDIPHSVIFAKLYGVLPVHVWLLPYRWYSFMHLTACLHGSLCRRLRVERGVRQGSITSPWLFNLVYQELVCVCVYHLFVHNWYTELVEKTKYKENKQKLKKEKEKKVTKNTAMVTIASCH